MAIGNDYLQRLFAQTNQDQPAQSEPEVDPIEELKIRLAEMGYDNNDYNVQKFLDANPDGNPVDMTQVTPQSEPHKLNSVGDFVRNSLVGTPMFEFLRGATGPLSLIAEGFKRYESAKVGVLGNLLHGGTPVSAGLNAAKGIAGKLETDFPEANLRIGEYPEMGDLFRSLGLPEVLSSSLGLVADVLDPAFLAGGVLAKGALNLAKPAVSQFIKETPQAEKFLNPLIKGYKLASGKISEGADKIIQSKYAGILRDYNIKSASDLAKVAETNADAAMEFVKSKWANVRANQLVNDTIDGLMGRGSLWHFAQPLKNKLRSMNGAEQLAQFDAASLSKQLNIFAKGDEKVLKNLNDVLLGNGGAIEALPKELQTAISNARNLIDSQSSDLAKILDDVDLAINKGKIPKREFKSTSDIIREHLGEYVTRRYNAFTRDSGWKFDETKINKAAQELADGGGFKSAEDAKQYLADLIADSRPKPGVTTGGQKLDPTIFKRRNEFGPAVRDFLGEITDPADNLLTSVQKIAQAKHNMGIFKSLHEAGLMAEKSSATHTEKLLNDPRLFLGKAEGMYTTKDVSTLLSHIFRQQNVLDDGARKAFQWLKASKTIGNLKTHMHNTLGNITFAILDGVTPLQRPKLYQEIIKSWQDVKAFQAGKLPKDHPSVKLWRDLIDKGVIGNEMPSNDQLRVMTEFIANPYSFKGAQKELRKAVAGVTDLYAFEDQLFKGASYLHKTRELKMAPEQALEKVYQSFPNYKEAAHIADTARNSTVGLMALNPFLTFQFEAHRILLNALKDPTKAWKVGAIMGSRLAYNSAILAMAGNGIKDIWEYVASDPKVASEYLLNPLNKDTGFNLKYTDPFNTSGMFAPFLAMAGATGQSPFDYLLDMTGFSQDFGYSNLLINTLKPALTGQGRLGEVLGPEQRANETVKALLPSSVAGDLPKVLDDKNAPDDRMISLFRMFGIDLEKRNPEYVKRKFSARLKDNVAKGADISGTVKIANMLGFDGERMAKTALASAKKTQKPVQKKASPHEALFKQLGI